MNDPRDVGFARMLAGLGGAILLLAAFLLALPSLLEGSLRVYVIAWGTAALFGPVGFSLLAAAWRIRNRAVHGTETPAHHRLRLRVLGFVLVGLGAFLALSGFGASGPLSRALDLVWGLSLAAYGIRYLVRSFASESP